MAIAMNENWYTEFTWSLGSARLEHCAGNSEQMPWPTSTEDGQGFRSEQRRLEVVLEEGCQLPGCDGRTIAVVEVHMRGAVDDEEFLGLRGGLGVKLLAVPQRSRLAAGDNHGGRLIHHLFLRRGRIYWQKSREDLLAAAPREYAISGDVAAPL